MPVHIQIKTAGPNISRKNCYRVATRNLNPNSGEFGKWVPLSRMGWQVVCLTERDAHELVLWVGGNLYPRPGVAMTDESYERWLLRHHFAIEHYSVTGRREMTWDEFHNGWVPGTDEITTGQSSPAIVHRVYQSRFADTPKGAFLGALHQHVSTQ